MYIWIFEVIKSCLVEERTNDVDNIILHFLKNQMLAQNSLNSCPDSGYQEKLPIYVVELIKWKIWYYYYLENRECPAGDCTGPTKRFSSCNTQKCPRGTIDYRTEQCSKFNSVPFERKMYQWIPYLKAPRKCELNCMPKGERFYYRHSKKVSKCLW